MRFLAFIGFPIAIVCLFLSRMKLVIPTLIFILLATRSLFTFIITGSFWMLLAFVISWQLRCCC